MSEQRLMKDGLNEAAVRRMANALAKVSDLPVESFVGAAMAGMDALELKERVRHLIGILHDFLPRTSSGPRKF